MVVARSNSQGIFVFKITMEKKCTKCGEVKSLDEFNNSSKGKNGKNSRCRVCRNKVVKQWRKNNVDHIKKYNKKYGKDYRDTNAKELKEKAKINYQKDKIKICERQKIYKNKNEEKIKKRAKEYRKENYESISDYKKEYYIKNKEQLNKKSKIYRGKNKQKLSNRQKIYIKNNQKSIKDYRKQYYIRNKDSIIKKTSEWNKQRMKTDIIFKLKRNISANIRTSLNKKGYKKNMRTHNILKCEYDFFMEWINGIASNGHQYGFGDLHLDHVVPMSLAQTEEEAILLNHYSNLQLLSADENHRKGDRYVNPLNLARVLEHHPNPDKIREIHSRL